MSPEWGSPNGPRAHPPRLFRLDLLLSTAGMGTSRLAVQRALSEGRIYTCWVVKAEVLVGAKDEEGFVTLLDNLRALPEIPVTGKLWEAAARLGYSMRRQGLTIPLPDLLIAQTAMEGNFVLWHIDEHFERMSRYSPLQTRDFLP